MLISDKWKDYELLDCSSGEKLERWGQYILIRPDPQIIWHSEKTHPDWQNADARYERSPSGGGRWRSGGLPERSNGLPDRSNGLPDRWFVKYSDLTFGVNLMNFKHTGLFPEQAVNWDYIGKKIKSAKRKISVLNLFAYTGGATLAAAAAGADVCHVDAARGMVTRARENAQKSGLDGKPIRWIIDDCTKFIERELRRGHTYDAIIMDPPSYGRGPAGEVWKLEDKLFGFMELCAKILSDDPLFVLINSYTTGLSPSTLTYITQTLLGGHAESFELGLPVTASGLVLPCGATCRWTP